MYNLLYDRGECIRDDCDCDEEGNEQDDAGGEDLLHILQQTDKIVFQQLFAYLQSYALIFMKAILLPLKRKVLGSGLSSWAAGNHWVKLDTRLQGIVSVPHISHNIDSLASDQSQIINNYQAGTLKQKKKNFTKQNFPLFAVDPFKYRLSFPWKSHYIS